MNRAPTRFSQTSHTCFRNKLSLKNYWNTVLDSVWEWAEVQVTSLKIWTERFWIEIYMLTYLDLGNSKGLFRLFPRGPP